METKKSTLAPATRLEIGAVILEAAQHVDTKRATGRLNAFAAVHRSYTAAQRRVETVEGQLRGLQAQLSENEAKHDPVETLARALVADGEPRANPFVNLGGSSPSNVKKLVFVEEAKAIHQLVAAVQRSTTAGQATRNAAKAADKAARAMEATLRRINTLEATLEKARRRRDTIGESWDNALAALKRRTRAAEDDGAAGLYTALFGRLARPKSKKKTATPTQAQATSSSSQAQAGSAASPPTEEVKAT